ncbi:hypothetical protein IAU59_000284 [Kwoniella sp. CBS 9459]
MQQTVELITVGLSRQNGNTERGKGQVRAVILRHHSGVLAQTGLEAYSNPQLGGPECPIQRSDARTDQERESLYLQRFFPVDMATAKDNRIDERGRCLEFFEKDVWMVEMENKGTVIEKGGESCPTKKWTSSVHNPMARRRKGPRQRMSEGYYKDNHGIQPYWSSWDHNPNGIDNDLKKKYRKFQVENPYFFLLRELWLRTQTTAQTPEALMKAQRLQAEPAPVASSTSDPHPLRAQPAGETPRVDLVQSVTG